MFLPLGDEPNPRGIPLVTYALLAANVVVYALVTLPLGATPVDPHDPLLREYARVLAAGAGRPVSLQEILQHASAYDLFVFRHGFRPADPSLRALFSSLFLHAGFAHLAGNMLFLWIYSDNVEHRLGRVWHLVAYLGTGVAATLFHSAFDPDSPLPLVGASGAISGMLGFYFVWFPRNRVRLLLFLFPFLMQVVSVPARLLLGLYLVMDNIVPFLIARGMEGGGVAHGAHIGGFLAGLAAAWFLDRREVAVRPAEFDVKGAPGEAASVGQLLAEGAYEEAARIYFGLKTEESRHVLTPEQGLRLAAWLREEGHPRAALVVYRRLVRDHPAGAGAAEAHLGAALVQLEEMDQPAAAYQHLLDALDLEPSAATAARARRALDEIEHAQKFRLASLGKAR